ncbi:MAG: glycine cleavage system protein GcvH [Trueperaceae bacterium]
MNIPTDLKYNESHEWLRDNGDGTATIGITEYAQDALGDVVFVELPKVGQMLSKKETFGVVESVKAASDLYSPVAGEVMEVNETLNSSPETINTSPYENGWIMKVKVSEVGDVLDAAGYAKVTEQ